MARARSRSRSYSPRPRGRSPPCERKSYDDYRYHPTDLRDSFERFHPLKDIYLQRNYYIGDPRGFGFVKYRYAEDAAEAMKRMNHKVIGGREVTIVFTEENRKTPQEMRTTNPTSDRYGDYKRSSHRPPRRRYSCK